MTNDRVVPLGVIANTKNTEPDHELICLVESLLERAKSGELRALAYVTLTSEGCIGTGWEGVSGSRWPIGTGVGLLQKRYMDALLED